MEAALDVFAERGFYGASIENICEKAGFTRGAFYSNFSTKEELFFALFDASGNELINLLRTALDQSRDSPDPVGAFVSIIDEKGPLQRRWYLVSTEFTLYAIRQPAAAAILAERDRLLRRETVYVINELVSIANRELTIDAELIARLATALREGVGAQVYVEPDAVDARMLERLALPAMLRVFSRPCFRPIEPNT
ncbi:TetR/AcrR family transcriptional regulator [Mycobacteroides chelonae]|uniref:TetR/AcrR family transcriptional regulator n=1 Tax=Mycobacteroides chelonae TaxID=1774 RepID=UPI001E52C27C|nr:TetR/AcrR family transcriptional regulator [Mycobacteroides chelonae]